MRNQLLEKGKKDRKANKAHKKAIFWRKKKKESFSKIEEHYSFKENASVSLKKYISPCENQIVSFLSKEP